MKCFLFKILILICLFSLIFHIEILADDKIEDVTAEDAINVSTNSTVEPKIYSRHAIVLDRKTETVLYEKDAYSQTAMASTTKIMTSIIVLENCNLSDEVTISKKAAGTGGSTLGITANTKMTIENLLYGLMLRSGNDCAVALAEHVGGSIEGFAILMNEKAKELNLKNTNFVTPHGLDSDAHFTTAYDLACLTKYALENKTFANIVQTKQISIMVGTSSRVINNTHELLGNVLGVYGVKTGFTGNAGRCLVTAVKRDDLDVIIVVLGADTKKIRPEDTRKLISYIFDNFENIDTYNMCFETYEKYFYKNKIKVSKSVAFPDVKLESRENYVFPVNKNDVNKIKISLYSLSVMEAPIKTNTKVGELRVSVDSKILYSLDVSIDGDVRKKDWTQYMKGFVFEIKNIYKN